MHLDLNIEDKEYIFSPRFKLGGEYGQPKNQQINRILQMFTYEINH